MILLKCCKHFNYHYFLTLDINTKYRSIYSLFFIDDREIIIINNYISAI